MTTSLTDPGVSVTVFFPLTSGIGAHITVTGPEKTASENWSTLDR